MVGRGDLVRIIALHLVTRCKKQLRQLCNIHCHLLPVQFFEDHQELDNRTAWAPLNLARYLIEKKEVLDPDWEPHAKALIDFVIRHFTVVRNGVLICGEQDYDKEPWGGIASSFGAILAMYSAATGSECIRCSNAPSAALAPSPVAMMICL